jgi:hypothetical protein
MNRKHLYISLEEDFVAFRFQEGYQNSLTFRYQVVLNGNYLLKCRSYLELRIQYTGFRILNTLILTYNELDLSLPACLRAGINYL